MQCLLLRFDAPLMSFGAVLVDQFNPTARFPAKSMLVGLLANALGWDHRDWPKLQNLQDRLRFAARWDAEPQLLTDYQTVDLGQDFLVGTGWTTRGKPEERGKGSATKETHQRWRDYWANGVATVALTAEGEGEPSVAALAEALRHPQRPLFIGRKPCLPAAPILLGLRQASTLKEALANEPLAEIGPRRRPQRIPALWPVEEGEGAGEEERFDVRDWQNNIHRGTTPYATGFLEVKP